MKKLLSLCIVAVVAVSLSLPVPALAAGAGDYCCADAKPAIQGNRSDSGDGGDSPRSQRNSDTLITMSKKTATYKVVFKAGGGKGKMSDQTIERGKATALKACKFTRSGYKFSGWNTKRNGKGESYKGKQKSQESRKVRQEGRPVCAVAQSRWAC